MIINSVQTFGARTISDYYREVIKNATSKVESYPHKQLVGMDTKELVEYLAQEYSLSPLELDDSRQIEYDKAVQQQQVRTIFDDTITQEKYVARITVPLKPYLAIAKSLEYTASSFTLKAYEFNFDDIHYSLTVYAEPEAVENIINEYKTLFQQRTAEILSNTTDFKIQLSRIIEQRKQKIKEDANLFEVAMQKISVPLKKREETPTYQVPLQVRKDFKRLSVPDSNPPKTLVLTEEQMNSIIKVIDVDGRNFENAPETFTRLEEPDLRNIIVSHLNHYFPDDVTGETFVKLGKTDIRLKVFEGEILIAECKYWSGEEDYNKAVDQLFKYLTWRYNFGVVIIFSRNSGFTEVLNRIQTATQKHSSYDNGFTKINETHFRSVHRFPEDPQKKIELHILIYNLYFKK